MTWAERPPYPAEEPPPGAGPEEIRDYEAKAFAELDQLVDTRRDRPDGSYVTYHWMLGFYGEYALHRVLDICRRELADPDLQPVPADRVYLPLLRIGAEEDLRDGELDQIEWLVRSWAGEQAQFRINLGPPAGGPGSVRLSVAPWEPVLEMRHALRRCTRQVLGLRPWLRELTPYRPHVPLAYCTAPPSAPLPADRIRGRLAALADLHPVRLRIRRISLVRITRSAGSARWYTVADTALGSRSGF